MKEISVSPAIYTVLYELGIPSNLFGCDCLAVGVALLLEEPNLSHGVCRGLYPKIGSIVGASSARVERRMRYAIEVGFNRCFPSCYDIFGNSVSEFHAVPSCMHFLTTVANRMKPAYRV